MSYLTNSWRQSLAAATFAALFVANAPPATADEPITEPSPELAVALDDDGAVVPAAFSEEERERIGARQRELGEVLETMNRTMGDIESKIPRMKEHGKQAIEKLLHKLNDDSISDEARHEIKQKIEMTKARIEQAVLEAKERAEMVREKRRQLELEKQELHQQMRNKEMETLHAQLKKLERERRRLGDQFPDRAHALAQRQRQIQKQIAEMERFQVDRRLDEQRRKLEQARHEIEALRARGKMEQAEVLARRVRAMEERFHAIKRERAGRPDDRPRGDDDFARRLEHIRIAADNLHAAGLHEQAEEILRAGEAMLHVERDRDPDMREPERSHAHEPELRDRDREPVEHLQNQIHELHQQIGEIREELGDIHRFMERVADRIEWDRD